MRYTHVNLAELSQEINLEMEKIGSNYKLLVWANGGTTSIYSLHLLKNIRLPLLEDVSRDEGYSFLLGFHTAAFNFVIA